MYYTSVINIHTTPSNGLVLFWLLHVGVVLMISPEVFTIYVSIITIKMVFFIATGASTDSRSFIICLITPISTILIISLMITFISTILIFSMTISISIVVIISLMIISISTILTIIMIISIFIMFIVSLMVISISIILTIIMIISSSTISCQIRIVWFGKHRRIFVLVR